MHANARRSAFTHAVAPPPHITPQPTDDANATCVHCGRISVRTEPYEAAKGPVTARASLHAFIMNQTTPVEDTTHGTRSNDAATHAPSTDCVHTHPEQCFFLQIDSHMVFDTHWDEQVVQSWERAQNPNAVLTTYAVPPYLVGDHNRSAPHLCRTRFTSEGVPTNLVCTCINCAPCGAMRCGVVRCLGYSQCATVPNAMPHTHGADAW